MRRWPAAFPTHASTMQSRRRSVLSLLLCLLTVVSVSACTSSGSSGESGGTSRRAVRVGDVVPLERRVDLIMGQTLVIPVQIPPSKYAAGPIPSLLEDGRDPGATLLWISVTPDPLEPVRWLPPAGRWRVTLSPEPGATEGFWAILINMPLDAIGQGLWIGGGRIDINWLPPALTDDADVARAALVPVAPEIGFAPGFAALVEPEFRSPIRRWRIKLLSEGLTPPSSSQTLSLIPGDETPIHANPADIALESLAIQYEARWSVALARLWRDNPDVCEQLRQILCAVVRLEGTVVVPAWPYRTNELDELLLSLLDPTGTPAARSRAVRLFIERQPVGIAWVIDDAGLIEGSSGRSLATLGLVNLSDRATLAWAAALRNENAPSLEPIEPRRGILLNSLASPTRRTPSGVGPGSAYGEIIAHIGRWNATWLVLSEPIAALPPGVRAGPFVPGWTLPNWLASTEPRAGPDDIPWTTAALVEKLPGPRAPWTLYFECLRPASAGNDADSVRVWLGPSARPTLRLRVSREGTIIDELNAERTVGFVTPPTVGPDRWAFRVEIPDYSIDSDGTVMLGMERFGSGTRRWSWPRAMTPWQTEPGRLRIDLKAWDTLGP